MWPLLCFGSRTPKNSSVRDFHVGPSLPNHHHSTSSHKKEPDQHKLLSLEPKYVHQGFNSADPPREVILNSPIRAPTRTLTRKNNLTKTTRRPPEILLFPSSTPKSHCFFTVLSRGLDFGPAAHKCLQKLSQPFQSL